MNYKFLELDEEKRLCIINAAMEVFAKNEYKRASTEEIAVKAGISKGLLFYYFHNKQELYLYVFDYCVELMKKSIDEKKIKSITDVFEMLRYGSEVKMKIISQNPYITDFIINAYYSDKDEVSCEMKNKIKVIMEEAYQLYFGHIDQTKLNNNVNLSLVYKMLIWIGEGILLEQRRLKRVIHYEDTLEKFDEVMKLMKKSIYKNEYLMEE